MLYLITGGAGFGLSLLSILMLVICHARDKKKLVPILLYVLGLLLFLGSAFLSWKGVRIPLLSDLVDGREETEESDSFQVEQGLLNVEITIPAVLFQGTDMDSFDPKAYAKENNFSKAVLNDDGSVTVSLPKNDYAQLVTAMADTYDNSFLMMVGAEDTPYIRSISRTDNFANIIIAVDREGYEELAYDLAPLIVGTSGLMYQTFAGVELRVEVVVKDAATGELITSAVYPDALT